MGEGFGVGVLYCESLQNLRFFTVPDKAYMACRVATGIRLNMLLIGQDLFAFATGVGATYQVARWNAPKIRAVTRAIRLIAPTASKQLEENARLTRLIPSTGQGLQGRGLARP